MEKNLGKKAVVTGGAGFVGSHIVRELLVQGYDVHVIDNYAGGKFPERISKDATYHDGDILDKELLKEAFHGASFVFHCAALPRVQYSLEHPEETHKVNVDGTLAVLVEAKNAGVSRIVYSASSSAYGDQEHMPLTEDMESHPQSPYALQKYAGELYCRLFSEVYELETVCLRYFNVYGPHADPNGPYALVVAKFIKQRLEGLPLTIVGDGKNTRDYTHVQDIVHANILAATSSLVGKGDVLNIGGGRNLSVNEVAEAVGGETVFVEARMEPKDTLADTSKAKQLIGWEPTISFEQGVEELKKEAGLA
jgi:nucleoside-diphosphate-sugar epimerase